ncbi:MAG: stalk domain-containing protein [bacterium]
MRILRIFACFFISVYLIASSPLDEYIANQDPLVEEAFRIFYNTIRKVIAMEEKVRMEVGDDAEKEARKLYANPQDNPIVWWEEAIHQLKEIERRISGRQPSEAIVDNLIVEAYGDLFGSLLMKCRWADAQLSKIVQDVFLQTGDIRAQMVLLMALNPQYVDDMLNYFHKAEAYNPNLCVYEYYLVNSGEVYYMVGDLNDEKGKWTRWDTMVKDLLRSRGMIKHTPFGEKIDEEQVAKGYGGGFKLYAVVKASEAYLAKRDYDKAIYYLEWEEEISKRLGIIEVGGSSPLSRIRREYLQELKNKGLGDKLHPFLYINGKPFDNRKGFTINGKPFISSIPFLEALNISSQWIKGRKILKVSKNEDVLYIADIRGGWRIYKGKEKRDVEAYLKGNELYLPLKELCKVLNLKLDWDEESYIGKVAGR